MHELSVALGILEIVQAACDGKGYGRVETVRVRIGRAAGVMPEALQFAFECSRAGTPADGARLEIEDVPLGGRCEDCGRDFCVNERYVLACPLCGGASFCITRGDELQVLELEVEE